MSALAAIAFSKASRLFSGKFPDAPRWAILMKPAIARLLVKRRSGMIPP
jgi:hypothetical protein